MGKPLSGLDACSWDLLPEMSFRCVGLMCPSGVLYGCLSKVWITPMGIYVQFEMINPREPGPRIVFSHGAQIVEFGFWIYTLQES